MKPAVVFSFVLLLLVGASVVGARNSALNVPRHPVGSVSFAKAITLKSPVLYPYSIAAGDLNHDGIPDLAVVGIEWHFLEHALGKGDGHVGYWSKKGGSGYAPSFVMFADLDLDGNLDALTNDASQRQIVISFGDGHGHFQQVKALDSGAGYATGNLAVADLNGDGIPDILGTALEIADDPGEIFVLLGAGHRKFKKPLHFSSGGIQPSGIVVGDLNHDGIPDLVVANIGTHQRGNYGNVAVLLGKGDGTFNRPVLYQAGKDPNELVLGDFNGDGNLDVAVGSQSKQVHVLLGNGDGTFGPSRASAGGSRVLAAADFNGDGKLDLVTARGGVSVLLGNGDGTFQRPLNFYVHGFPFNLVVADFNHDGKPDVATIQTTNSSSFVSILLNSTP